MQRIDPKTMQNGLSQSTESTSQLPTAQARIWIDMTFTIDSPLKAGVARVVDKVATNMPPIALEQNIDAQAVVFRDGCFQLASKQLGLVRWDYRRFRKYFSSWLPQRYRYCASLFPKPMAQFIAPKDGKLGCFFLPVAIASVFVLVYRWLSLPARCVRIRPHDILLLPDGYWATKRIWQGVRLAKARGVTIVFIVYDLIGIQHPEYFGPEFGRVFSTYLRNVCQNANLIVTISRSVAADLRAYIKANPGLTEYPRIGSFQLGCDFDATTPAGHSGWTVRQSLRNVFDTGRPIYLVVSTIEPRKNHALVLDAFELVWQRSDVCLLIIGRLGWLFEKVVARWQSHKMMGTRLFHVSDVDDRELAACYQHATAVICPSLAEGYGLTIVEALRFGKKVFASDIPVHREVGGDNCEFFAKDDVHDLAQLIEQHAQSTFYTDDLAPSKDILIESPAGEIPNSPKPTHHSWLISWETSMRQLLTQLMTLPQVELSHQIDFIERPET